MHACRSPHCGKTVVPALAGRGRASGRTHEAHDRSSRLLLPVREHRRRVGLHGDCLPQSRRLGVVPDSRLRERGGPLRPDGRRVPRDDPRGGLRRRGRRAVPVRGDDARRGFRRAAPGLPAIPADRRADRRDLPDRDPVGRRLVVDRSGPRAGAFGQCRERGEHDQRPGAGPRDLHGLRVFLPDRRPHPLVAMIGAIVLTLRDRPGVKRQNIAVQNARTQATAVETRKVPSRQGVEPLPHRRGDPVHARRARHLHQPQEHHRHPDVGRADPALGQHQPRGLLDPAERHHRTGLRPVRADRRGGRIGHRPRHPGGVLPQPRIDRGRGREHDEGLIPAPHRLPTRPARREDGQPSPDVPRDRLLPAHRRPHRRPVRALSRRAGLRADHHGLPGLLGADRLGRVHRRRP
ncbi:hypothetical protein Lal_00044877 [Lupinus albus]|nr:hypothetical protein Lal_00044877 [Lupinus albus]